MLPESKDTTHFSVADEKGNMVSNTYTLNASFGSGIVVPGTGMLQGAAIVVLAGLYVAWRERQAATQGTP